MIMLSDATQGAVVKWSESYLESIPLLRITLDYQIGHVVRFSMNAADEVVIMVLWCDQEEPLPVHPSNIHLV